ncbi:hypothetical protein C1646_769006 [Rhizophagus diaphanus]|nr:hypothetical protein C1646_769006 [Rhizophagus diaphanus] [Rhizophagus sp. MUCL 43196]
MLQKLNERVSNLKINYINHTNPLMNRTVKLSFGKKNSTFTNNNNKRVKKFQEIRELNKATQSIPDVQSYTFSPTKEDHKANKSIDQKFNHFMNNQEPYINTDKAKEFNNGTTNFQNLQK